jgi:hypothetical protein
MKRIWPGAVLLLLQVLIVLTIAGKYWYERQTRPRVWVRTEQYDPDLPLRGRYLAMRLVLDACGLAKENPIRTSPRSRVWQWHVSLSASGGKLVPHVEKAWQRGNVGTLTLSDDHPCDRATMSGEQLLFIPDRAQLPLPLKPGQDLWVEVTVPASGPPRPIQVAVSGADGFHPLRFE